MQQRITQITLVPECETIFAEGNYTITIVDEGGGEFIEVAELQSADAPKIRIDKSDWPELRDAIDRMMDRVNGDDQAEEAEPAWKDPLTADREKRLQRQVDELHELLDSFERDITNSEDAEATVNQIVKSIHRMRSTEKLGEWYRERMEAAETKPQGTEQGQQEELTNEQAAFVRAAKKVKTWELREGQMTLVVERFGDIAKCLDAGSLVSCLPDSVLRLVAIGIRAQDYALDDIVFNSLDLAYVSDHIESETKEARERVAELIAEARK